MIKSYKANSFINGLRFSYVKTLKENRFKFFLSVIFAIVAFCFGIYIAVRYSANETLSNLQEISLSNFASGVVGSSSAFFSRSFSLLINVLILFGISFVPFLFPLALVMLSYRAYLFGLNLSLIFILYGLGGCLTAIVVIFPLQLLTLLTLIFFYLILSKINYNSKRYGSCECNRITYLLVGFLVLLVLNLVETLLLFLLNGQVIMVI